MQTGNNSADHFFHTLSLLFHNSFDSHNISKSQHLLRDYSVVYCLFIMKVSIFSLFLLFCCASSDDPLPCRFSDGTFGKCVDIKNCKSLYGLFRQGTVRIKDLPICDSVKRLVCCPRIGSKSENLTYKNKL